MDTVQLVLGAALIRAADEAAKRAHINRSALVREALRQHLKRLKMGELEARDRAGYEEHPGLTDDAEDWERVAAWPEP